MSFRTIDPGYLASLMSKGWSWRSYSVVTDSNHVCSSGLVWRGEWDDSATYTYGDIVQYNGAAYIVGVVGSSIPPGVTPDEDPTNWHLMDAASDIAVTF